MTCPHLNFEAKVDVSRLSHEEGWPITGYTADVRIRCAHCGVPFAFKGMLPGSSPNYPMVSVDRDELRAPIEPAPDAPRWPTPASAGTA